MLTIKMSFELLSILKIAIVVSLDMHKAFDHINHQLLNYNNSKYPTNYSMHSSRTYMHAHTPLCCINIIHQSTQNKLLYHLRLWLFLLYIHDKPPPPKGINVGLFADGIFILCITKNIEEQ